MMSDQNLTPDAINLIEKAVNDARARHNIYVDSEHLLIGALNSEFACEALHIGGGDPPRFLGALEAELAMKRDEPLKNVQGLTATAKNILNEATRLSERMGHRFLNSGHILLSILQSPDPFTREVLKNLPALNLDDLELYIQENSTPPSAAFMSRWRPITWEHHKLISSINTNTTSKKSEASPAISEVSKLHQTVATSQSTPDNSNLIWWILSGILVISIFLFFVNPGLLISVGIVVGGWMISLTLHEFGHALVAYIGGDHTVKNKGYLTLNPIRYTHPLLSIGLPMVFLAMGGIGLPGGAVYIERHRLHNKWWGAAVSAAGPLANLICLVIFAAPFWTGYVTPEVFFENERVWAGLAFLCWLQGIAIVLNLLPIPPLDGFGIIEPFLPEETAMQMRSLGSIGFLLVLMLFLMPSFGGVNPSDIVSEPADELTIAAGVEDDEVDGRYYVNGRNFFMFWRDD
jgi:Zn-dependent protease